MIDFGTLAAVGAAFVIVAASPGPANLAAATVAVTHGRRVGLIFALGLSLGLWFWGLLAATGVGAVLQTSAQALFVLKLLGAAYLLWLAFQSARSAVRPGEMRAPQVSAQRWFFRGVILNMSNPKAVFAWMAALSVGLDPTDGIAAVIAATILCGLIGLVNACGWALLFSQNGVMRGYRRVRRWVDGVVAGLFAAASLGMLRSAFAR
ncbi:MAG: LysE family translocator [Pseudomonadota bacterium]